MPFPSPNIENPDNFYDAYNNYLRENRSFFTPVGNPPQLDSQPRNQQNVMSDVAEQMNRANFTNMDISLEDDMPDENPRLQGDQHYQEDDMPPPPPLVRQNAIGHRGGRSRRNRYTHKKRKLNRKRKSNKRKTQKRKRLRKRK